MCDAKADDIYEKVSFLGIVRTGLTAIILSFFSYLPFRSDT